MAVTRKAAEELSELKWRSAARTVEEAAEARGKSPQGLVDGLMQQPETAQLLADAMQAAADTFDRRKVSALARALANGAANDGTRVDSERLMIRALADLDPAHVRLLHMLSRSLGRNHPWTAQRLRSLRTFGPEGEELPVLNANVFELMPVLLRHGLAEENADARWDAQVNAIADLMEEEDQRLPMRGARPIEAEFVLTDFGRRALDYLQAPPAL